ncbi:MAG TPA: acyl-CoA dehydratase activase [Thermodesulfobacteriota bacterium]|nr:2-hydroxyglutaryl-CoA dehydratase [Deltaproteobacteria bacterium]HNU72475.1 acyl-CoA dehydratase activase [Thermodesulfobacteriota bacterium]
MSDYFAGIDIGSTMTKVAIIGEKIIASIIGPTGAEQRRLASQVMEKALAQAGLSLSALTVVVATGYGRINVPFADKQMTEITCHSRGVFSFFPHAATIIDIGGQDSKAIRIENGRPVDFAMNDKCAAGSGRFLEIIADALSLRLEEMAHLALTSVDPIKIGNLCTVFAEQEVIDRLAEGAPLPDLVAGIHQALASRIASLARRVRVVDDVVLTGGGAKNPALSRALAEELGHKLLIPSEPLLTGAVGAALLGKEIADKARRAGKPFVSKRRELGEVKLYQ